MLEERLVVPDLSGWRLDAEHPIPPPFVFTNPITTRRDWCCEVMSASTRQTDRETKLPLYAEAGVEWIWLLDPDEQTIEIFRTPGRRIELVDRLTGDVQRVIPPFASSVDTSRWWVQTSPTG